MFGAVGRNFNRGHSFKQVLAAGCLSKPFRFTHALPARTRRLGFACDHLRCTPCPYHGSTTGGPGTVVVTRRFRMTKLLKCNIPEEGLRKGAVREGYGILYTVTLQKFRHTESPCNYHCTWPPQPGTHSTQTQPTHASGYSLTCWYAARHTCCEPAAVTANGQPLQGLKRTCRGLSPNKHPCHFFQHARHGFSARTPQCAGGVQNFSLQPQAGGSVALLSCYTSGSPAGLIGQTRGHRYR
jgi:hypothetical protein